MIGQGVLGKFPLGRRYRGIRVIIDNLDLGLEYEFLYATSVKASNPVHYTVLGRHRLGSYSLATDLLKLDPLYIEHEYDQVIGITQIHNININNMNFDLVFPVLNPSQAHGAYLDDIEFSSEYENISPITQVHIITPSPIDFPLEYDNVDTILPTVNFQLEFEHITSTTQTHNISVINELRFPLEFEEIQAIQAHVIGSISNYDLYNQYEQLSNVTQLHVVLIDNMDFELDLKNIDAILAFVDFPLEYDMVADITQVHNIPVIDDMDFSYEFEEFRAVQVYMIDSVSDYDLHNEYSAVLDVTQIHNIQVPDINFELSYNKIFAEVILGGYMFVTIIDGESSYNLSFEGIESE